MSRVALVLLAASGALASPQPAETPPAALFDPQARAVSTWRAEAASHLTVSATQRDDLRGAGAAPQVARCVKLNNYWCIKKAGWNGEIAADAEGHVAFASAVEGAAVAAILLKRYYLDFNRKSARAIVSHWAPAQCGLAAAAAPRMRAKKPAALAGTLRARWLASHARGFASALPGRKSTARRSIVADRTTRSIAAPTIAVGLGERTTQKPMTLDALLASTPNAPPSRSMLGMPRPGASRGGTMSLSACGDDTTRIAAYADKAATGIVKAVDDDLQLFTAEGAPTKNLAAMMANMAGVEIGPLGPTADLVEAGIVEAFRPGRNPAKAP